MNALARELLADLHERAAEDDYYLFSINRYCVAAVVDGAG
jgi:hypothetical protein